MQCKYLHDYDDVCGVILPFMGCVDADLIRQVKELIDEKHDEVYESGDTIQRA